MSQPTLYLVPSGLGGLAVTAAIPSATLDIVRSLECFVVEDPKSARAFLKAIGHPGPLQGLHIATLDEHTPEGSLPELLSPLLDGRDCGLLSEAGCPAVADPGAPLIRLAHRSGIKVVPLVGPSAVLLALMASGMNGQNFAFHGYLPVESRARAKRLLDLERESEGAEVTQIFIEAPYRNTALFDALVQTCADDTLLCLATDLTQATESIETRLVAAWKTVRPALDRRPTVFLLYRERRGRGQKR